MKRTGKPSNEIEYTYTNIFRVRFHGIFYVPSLFLLTNIVKCVYVDYISKLRRDYVQLFVEVKFNCGKCYWNFSKEQFLAEDR